MNTVKQVTSVKLKKRRCDENTKGKRRGYAKAQYNKIREGKYNERYKYMKSEVQLNI